MFTTRGSVGSRRAAALLIVALLWLVLPSTARAEAAKTWEPAKTWVFAVGVLEWKDASFTTYPKEGRCDAELVARLKARGVPEDQVVYLQDDRATRERIEQRFKELLRKTRAGDFLIVYYAGHGCRDRTSGATYFANYDATGDRAQNFWSVAGIFDAIERDFKGSHAFLAADCCFSGALGEVARKRTGNVAYACLASVHEHCTSTGNWTFTECLLRGLAGAPQFDRDGDRHITLEELARETEEEMAFAEKQRASFTVTKGFDARLRLAEVKARPEGLVGRRLEVEWKDSWYAARVIETKKDESKVHYVGFDASWDEWVTEKRMRPYAPKQLAAGTTVEVLWEGKWYPAKVLEGWKGLNLVHYDNFTDEWDEWVGPQRLRKPAVAPADLRPGGK